MAPIGPGVRGRPRLLASPGGCVESGCGSRCGGGAEAWTRPASAPGPSECAPPPSERHGGGAGADPCYPEPKENRAKVCREVLHSQLAVPCLSLLPEHPAYTAPVAKLGSIDRACPARGIEMLQSCFTDTVPRRFWLVDCPALGPPTPRTLESLKMGWVGLEKASCCSLLKTEFVNN